MHGISKAFSFSLLVLLGVGTLFLEPMPLCLHVVRKLSAS